MSDQKKKSNTYKDSLNLPQTDFPMRANLVEREPQRLKNWEDQDLYRQIVDQRQAQNAPTFILHDGPPFANGDVHMGTALNKVLKDLVIKSRTMAGYYAPFIPGWDCHGLPIEFKVVEKTRGLEPAEIRRRSEAYARKFIDIQRKSFRRLGVFGDWENPYLTLDPSYEADVIRTFASLVEKDLVYCSKKPVLWSFGAQTALAEAEVEYEDRTDPAIFVKFPLASGDLTGKTSLVIWTTTPWTLPANLGIALQSRFEYVRCIFTHAESGRSEDLIIARPLLDSFIAKTGFSPTGEEQIIDPKALEGQTAQHPLLDRTSKIILADFVTAEAGTGAVHVAPGHGSDDYIAGLQNDLGLLSPVDDRGCFTDDVGIDSLIGQHVFKGNPIVIELLDNCGALLAQEDYVHSYPHCWRSKTPIIFRSVEQFFVRIDAIRDQALAEIDQVEWMPHWGRNRIHGTVESRPDWCISRQRTWGVPLPVFFPAGKPDQPIVDADLARKVADLTEQQGTNLWFEKDDAWWAAQLDLPAGTTRCHDTLDVWIDSGSSHVAVLDKRPELHTPADLYLEATDQHRGWFQSSLMLSVAHRGTAPYKTVMTHGFVVDKDRKKISKSDAKKKGKPMDAAHFYNQYGADILRLWVSSVDWQNEVPFDENLFKQTADTYRRIRNTLRILLGNLNGFDAENQSVDNAELTLIDRWILERLHFVTTECIEAYQNYEFRKVFNTLNQFCAVDLSSLYIDITKDRMYCEAIDSVKRRATQTAMARVFESLTLLMAPILVYTADEAWEFLGKKDSIHLQDFPTADPAFAAGENAASPVVEELLKLRATIQQEIESARQQKLIGSNLEAQVKLDVPNNAVLDSVLDDQDTVQEFLIVSDLQIQSGQEKLFASVAKTDNGKCARCWRHEKSVGQVASHEDLCQRCADVV
ncbi:MAG: isoleucine--tRNA ligase [Verrucomicrobiales bacterium]|nr:isoleucine--tRNA ligase [Verrucomicrobiales bacterium]